MDIHDIQDFSRRYKDTYIRYNGTVMYVKRVDRDLFGGYSFQLIHGEEHVEYVIDIDTIDTSFPPIGVVNLNNSVIITSKYPSRQWKRACCEGNYCFYDPITDKIVAYLDSNNFMVDIKKPNISFNLSNITKIYNNVYYSLDEAIKELNTGNRIACAISSKFFLINSLHTSGNTLYRMETPVAELEDCKVTILHPELAQEVYDF